MIENDHVPVMVEEIIQTLAVIPGGRYIDATVGTGGHAKAILEHSQPGGQLLGFDLDLAALKRAEDKLGIFGSSVVLVNDSYANIKSIGVNSGFSPVHGILFDLGLSSFQLSDVERGFSFRTECPLDMRFGLDQVITADDIINSFSEIELASLLWRYGEEPNNRQIARTIVRNRPIQTTTELAKLIEKVPIRSRHTIHPATRTFQALRIAVNNELNNLERALGQALDLLGFGGRLAVISYHSLEDRIVKKFIQRESRDCICPPEIPVCQCDHGKRLRPLHSKVIVPTDIEKRFNRRSRSAKLRAAERTIFKKSDPGSIAPVHLLAGTMA
jgi:16S rRNA (cytosine1402-N4)-methyltransferase